MNEEQQRIWNYLNTNALGYNARKSSTEIRKSCNLESGGATNEHVRELIRDMILNHNCCIGSLMWKDGYWIIQTPVELESVTKSLRSRASSIDDRADALERNYNHTSNG